jgi:hypothetical protein
MGSKMREFVSSLQALQGFSPLAQESGSTGANGVPRIESYSWDEIGRAEQALRAKCDERGGPRQTGLRRSWSNKEVSRNKQILAVQQKS